MGVLPPTQGAFDPKSPYWEESNLADHLLSILPILKYHIAANDIPDPDVMWKVQELFIVWRTLGLSRMDTILPENVQKTSYYREKLSVLKPRAS